MSNRILPPPFIAEPPIYDPFLDEDGSISNPWMNWLNSVTRVMGYTIVHDYLVVPAVNPEDRIKEKEVPLLQATSLVETQNLPGVPELGRDQLQNARDGTILYNTTTNRFNFRENGAWVTFAPVAA